MNSRRHLDEIISLVRQVADSKLPARTRQLRRQVADFREQASFQGGGIGSRFQVGVGRLCADELKARGFLFWEEFQRIASELGVEVSEDLGGVIDLQVERWLAEQAKVRLPDATRAAGGGRGGPGC